MNSQCKVEINGEEYLAFASENVKRLLLRNKLSVVEVITKYADKPFTKNGNATIQKINDANLCILNIKAFDIDENEEIKCFILHVVGNYTDIIPVASNKWSVKLACGHRAIVDTTVDSLGADHIVPCFICKK